MVMMVMTPPGVDVVDVVDFVVIVVLFEVVVVLLVVVVLVVLVVLVVVTVVGVGLSHGVSTHCEYQGLPTSVRLEQKISVWLLTLFHHRNMSRSSGILSAPRTA